ncbi:hypothetical protein SteCoe_34948 [Stentor coeruleus]|uniref:Mic1 domain-containing protein n=1 Tax=Stentor coeruleus TaxID=5963 RepID=A0A1R2ATD7_9CILI|nr:hypothetical protein SteCoe_34948 [Stentor coeruleus]
MEFTQVSKWNNLSNLFFDEYEKTVFYIHSDRLYISGAHNYINLSPYSKYVSRPIFKAAVDEARETLILELKQKKLHIFALKEICTNKIRVKHEILGFFPAKHRAISWELCIITINSLEFVKIDDDLKTNFKFSASHSISYYNVDVFTGILVLYSVNSAVVYTTYEKKPRVLVKIPLDYHIAQLPGVTNLFQYNLPQLDYKFLLVVNVYSKMYLLNLDGFSGVLQIYSVSGNKEEIYIDSGAYNVRVIDNLIILHNFGLQESTIIDWLSEPKYFKINHRGSFELNPTLVRLSNEHALDVQSRQFLKLKLEPLSWIDSLPNIQYAIDFYLRRQGTLPSSLNLMKEAILSNKSIEFILKKLVRKEEHIPLITQDQIYTSVFLQCFKENCDLSYLTKAILLYCKELIFNNITLELQLEMLVIRVLIKAQDFVALQDLITYHIIADSKDIALLIVDLSKRSTFQYGYLLGIDMLYRLKLYTIAMDVMISQGDYVETMNLLMDHPCPGYDLSKLHKDSNDAYTNMIIQEFLKDNIY